jgi:geranylgeranyl pyrophosphate synthase
MIDELEKVINKYFPATLTEKEILFFLKKVGFEIDVSAVNANLNLPIRDFVLRGGKRLRPVLFMQTLELFGVDYKKYKDFAVSIELLHNGTLILDDIEDDGELRRGKPTCHRKFGIDTAVNVGGALYIMPLMILQNNSKNLTAAQKLKINQIYTEELINLSFGQSIDIYWHNHPNINVSKDEYLEMVRLKTGSLMRMSLRMACVIAGKDGKIESCFKDFAEKIGMAFQIKDDALDLTSKDERFGKSFGNDISEGKISLPVVLALESASLKDKKNLVEILSLHTRNKAMIRQAVNIINNTQAVEKSIKFANELVDQAWKRIEIDCSDIKKFDALKELTYFFVKREY